MKTKNSLVFALILIVCAGSLVVVGPVHGDWNVESSPTAVTLYDIWGASESDIYAVGEQETILHNDGTGWEIVSSLGNGDPFRDVSGNSGSNIYAVGDNGLAKYFDGNSWGNPDGFINTGANLNGVWGSSDGDVYALGSDAKIIDHFDGNAWRTVFNPVDKISRTVFGEAPGTMSLWLARGA